MCTIANILIIILEIIAFCLILPSRRWKIFAFYTQLSNLVALISSVCFLIFGEKAAIIRYVSSCMLTMTFLITLFVLVPMGAGFSRMMFYSNGLYHHTLCPIISVYSYVFLEAHSSAWYIPTIITLVYGLTMMYLNAKELYEGPYPFFRVNDQSRAATVMWIFVLMLVITAISAGIAVIAG